MWRNVRGVFVILGNNCNLNCAYCMQHEICRVEPKQHINPDVIAWLKELSINNKRLRITFYGGEPLIYFSTLKQLVELLDDRNIRFSVITNGKALTGEMVSFFNKYNVHVAISWDGRNVLKTRGFDVFASNKENVLAINNLGLTGVVSAYAYPLNLLQDMQVIADEYRNIHGYALSANLDLLFDLGLADQSLNNFDYDRIIEQAKQITGIYLYGDKNKSSCVASYMDARMGEINYIIKQGFQPICRCDNGYKVLNVDLNGKLYSCHNSRDVVGDIYQEPNKCIECNICYDRVIRRRLEICEHCPCYLMCDGGCKLISQEKLEQGYCKLRQCFWGTMLDCLSKYKEVKTE